jgi:hypothetical protein
MATRLDLRSSSQRQIGGASKGASKEMKKRRSKGTVKKGAGLLVSVHKALESQTEGAQKNPIKNQRCKITLSPLA